ncbi:dihydrofolate synthase [Egibacter rhizosphaerae]|uniref:tetrahydrofolate synthase n=1 Tax=Egibacter rhizosphaerae TaxID=1670831 RepID=A0A411YDM0_9ACTN|nr:Mur ligase family protein [Egibacter rhizosphaerae]QBI19247.1 dihydrofolate synthase [Egibacter rhizosphaerae]
MSAPGREGPPEPDGVAPDGSDGAASRSGSADHAYDEAVRALFSRRPDRMVPGLGRIRALCTALGEPQRAFRAVHVTGTNGKTTLASLVSALLVAHGVRAGTYTSPHLQEVGERVRVDGAPLGREELVDTLARLRAPLAEVEAARDEMVTFFETLTALAYERFARAGVEIAAVEVGMGGRWDATNVVDADVAVINPVRLDHAELGSTVGEVAGEKAGIIADGATVVSAAQEPEAAAVIEAEARARDATVLRAGTDFAVVRRTPGPAGQQVALRSGDLVIDDITLPLRGAHQAANAACALAAVEAMLSSGLDPDAVHSGFAAVRCSGRLEVVRSATPRGAPVVLDGAHNPAGAAALADALVREFPARRRTLVLGAMGDKDYGGIVDALLPVCDRIVTTQAPTGRSAPPDALAKQARLAGRDAEPIADIGGALEAAGASAGAEDLVVVTGSLYLVGAARDALGLPVR